MLDLLKLHFGVQMWRRQQQLLWDEGDWSGGVHLPLRFSFLIPLQPSSGHRTLKIKFAIMPTELKRAGKDGGEGESREEGFERSKFRRDENPVWTGERGGSGRRRGEKNNFARERAPERGSKGRERGKRGMEIALHAASWERQRGGWKGRASEGSRSVVAPEGVDGGEERKGQRGSERSQKTGMGMEMERQEARTALMMGLTPPRAPAAKRRFCLSNSRERGKVARMRVRQSLAILWTIHCWIIGECAADRLLGQVHGALPTLIG